MQLPGLPAEIANLANRRAGHAFGQLAALLLDQELSNADVAPLFFRRRSPREQMDKIRAVGKGAPGLGAVDDELIAVARRPACDVGEVGARVGFGEREGAEEFAARHRRIVLALLLLAGIAIDSVAARDDTGDAHPRPREFFRHQRVFESAEAQPAVLLGNEDSEVTERAHLVAQIHRDLAFDRIELVRDRQHLVHREVARGLLDHFAFFSQVTHLAVPRLGIRLERRKSTTRPLSPSARNPSVCHVTMPLSGRLCDSRLSSTVLRATSVAPG